MTTPPTPKEPYGCVLPIIGTILYITILYTMGTIFAWAVPHYDSERREVRRYSIAEILQGQRDWLKETKIK
jgi:hypothetical protein